MYENGGIKFEIRNVLLAKVATILKKQKLKNIRGGTKMNTQNGIGNNQGDMINVNTTLSFDNSVGIQISKRLGTYVGASHNLAPFFNEMSNVFFILINHTMVTEIFENFSREDILEIMNGKLRDIFDVYEMGVKVVPEGDDKVAEILNKLNNLTVLGKVAFSDFIKVAKRSGQKITSIEDLETFKYYYFSDTEYYDNGDDYSHDDDGLDIYYEES